LVEAVEEWVLLHHLLHLVETRVEVRVDMVITRLVPLLLQLARVLKELFLEVVGVEEVQIIQQIQNKVDRPCMVVVVERVEALDRVEVHLVVSVELLFLRDRVVQVILDLQQLLHQVLFRVVEVVVVVLQVL
jgi:hypothetical protein